jgi:hypothetical protein
LARHFVLSWIRSREEHDLETRMVTACNPHTSLPLISPVTATPIADACPIDLTDRQKHLALLHPASVPGRVELANPIASDDGEWENWGGIMIKSRDLIHSDAVPSARYVSMNRFGLCRAAKHLVSLGAIWAEIDHYKDKRGPDGRSHWESRTPKEIAGLLLARLEEADVPAPSIILFTGRGHLCAWLHDPRPAEALPVWRRVMDALWGTPTDADVKSALQEGVPLATACPRKSRWTDDREQMMLTRRGEIWSGLCLDRATGDPTRVFRVAGTVHEVSGHKAHLVWPPRWESMKRYDFQVLADALLPYTRDELRELRASREAAALESVRNQVPRTRQTPQGHTVRSRARAFIADLDRLRAHRYGDGKVSAGARDTFCYLYASALAWLEEPDLEAWTERLAEIVAASPATIRGWIKPTVRLAEEAACGGKKKFGDRQVDPRYKLSVRKAVEMLGVDAREVSEAGLTLIVPPGVTARKTATERSRDRRRRDGAQERSLVQAARRAAGEEALRRHANGETITAIAKAMGYSRRWLHKGMAEARSCSVGVIATAAVLSESVTETVHSSARYIVALEPRGRGSARGRGTTKCLSLYPPPRSWLRACVGPDTFPKPHRNGGLKNCAVGTWSGTWPTGLRSVL